MYFFFRTLIWLTGMCLGKKNKQRKSLIIRSSQIFFHCGHTKCLLMSDVHDVEKYNEFFLSESQYTYIWEVYGEVKSPDKWTKIKRIAVTRSINRVLSTLSSCSHSFYPLHVTLSSYISNFKLLSLSLYIAFHPLLFARLLLSPSGFLYN